MKLRVLQPVYFGHRLRAPGEILEVSLADLPAGEVPRWAVKYEAKFCPGINPRRERSSFGTPRGGRTAAPTHHDEEVEELEFSQ